MVHSRSFMTAGQDGGQGVRMLSPLADLFDHSGQVAHWLLSGPSSSTDSVEWVSATYSKLIAWLWNILLLSLFLTKFDVLNPKHDVMSFTFTFTVWISHTLNTLRLLPPPMRGSLGLSKFSVLRTICSFGLCKRRRQEKRFRDVAVKSFIIDVDKIMQSIVSMSGQSDTEENSVSVHAAHIFQEVRIGQMQAVKVSRIQSIHCMTLYVCRWSVMPPSDTTGWTFQFKAAEDAEEGSEATISYGNHDSGSFLIHYGFVPPRNVHDRAVLFKDVEEAVAWFLDRFPPEVIPSILFSQGIFFIRIKR